MITLLLALSSSPAMAEQATEPTVEEVTVESKDNSKPDRAHSHARSKWMRQLFTRRTNKAANALPDHARGNNGDKGNFERRDTTQSEGDDPRAGGHAP